MKEFFHLPLQTPLFPIVLTKLFFALESPRMEKIITFVLALSTIREKKVNFSNFDLRTEN